MPLNATLFFNKELIIPAPSLKLLGPDYSRTRVLMYEENVPRQCLNLLSLSLLMDQLI